MKTVFLYDTYPAARFRDRWAARYGFLAEADRYQQYKCDFYLASFYHFACLLNQDYETGQRLMADRHVGG